MRPGPRRRGPGLGGSRGTPAEAESAREGLLVLFFLNSAPLPIWRGKQACLPFWMKLISNSAALFKNIPRLLFCLGEVG